MVLKRHQRVDGREVTVEETSGTAYAERPADAESGNAEPDGGRG